MCGCGPLSVRVDCVFVYEKETLCEPKTTTTPPWPDAQPYSKTAPCHCAQQQSWRRHPCVCVCVCLSVNVYVCVCVWVCVWLSLNVCVCVCNNDTRTLSLCPTAVLATSFMWNALVLPATNCSVEMHERTSPPYNHEDSAVNCGRLWSIAVSIAKLNISMCISCFNRRRPPSLSPASRIQSSSTRAGPR